MGCDLNTPAVSRHRLETGRNTGIAHAKVRVGAAESVYVGNTTACLVGEQLCQVAIETLPVRGEGIQHADRISSSVGTDLRPYHDFRDGNI